MQVPELTQTTLLLVDNSRPVRAVLKTLLTGLGVRHIHEACHGDDALVSARLGRPDLAILDHDLGARHDYALVRQFRDPGLSPDPHIPLILLAPTGLAWCADAARAAGADAVLPKPVTASTLGRRIAELTGLAVPDADPAAPPTLWGGRAWALGA
ncbi:response regulator [Maricaulis sp. CAU 1757]